MDTERNKAFDLVADHERRLVDLQRRMADLEAQVAPPEKPKAKK